jgi:hypothetical protein
VPPPFSTSAELPRGNAAHAWAALAACPALSGSGARWAWTARLLDADHDEREANFAVRARAHDGRGYLGAELRAAIVAGTLRIYARSHATGDVGDDAVLDAVAAELRRAMAEAPIASVDRPVPVPRSRERTAIRVLLAILVALILLDRHLGRRS